MVGVFFFFLSTDSIQFRQNDAHNNNVVRIEHYGLVSFRFLSTIKLCQ